MEADWDELALVQLPPPGPHHAATPIATLAFDTSQELLWTGNNHVRAHTLPAALCAPS